MSDNSDAPPADIDDDMVDQLVASFATHGLNDHAAFSVRRHVNPGGAPTFIVIDGNHRLRAIREGIASSTLPADMRIRSVYPRLPSATFSLHFSLLIF